MESRTAPDVRLAELGITLPDAPAPVGTYVPVRRSGNLLFVSGHAPWSAPQEVPVFGKVGADLTAEQARQAARLTGLNILATLRAELGSLDLVTGIVKVFGMVNCAPGFIAARPAIGVAELPFGYAVEIEAIAQVT